MHFEDNLDEEELFNGGSVVYRYGYSTRGWENKACGILRILKSRADGKIRILMRERATDAVCLNHWIVPPAELKNHGTSNTSFIWIANDFSKDVPSMEVLCARFANQEIA